MLSHKASLVLSLDGLVDKLIVVGSLGGLLRSLALLGRSVGVVLVVVLEGRLLAALLRGGLVLGLWGGERGDCTRRNNYSQLPQTPK